MFGHRSFLMLGGDGAADILSLIKGGYEVADCEYSFNQGVNEKGKATTKVHGGTMTVTLSQLPPLPVIEWGMKSRNYQDGVIVVVDAENIPLEKIFFKQAACVDMEVDYTQTGNSYASTKLILQAARLIVGDGIDFENEWTDH
ncbi:MAG: type VI secretion system needle protein Hcp [Tannerella sp.]|jgi:hypothetical protein|nr:type VI secretion system needle protein Hcp [Tannerella sp.]